MFLDIAPVAQWIARWTSNPKVAGSSPAGGEQIVTLVFYITYITNDRTTVIL